MKNKLLFLIVSISSVLTFNSCKKDKSDSDKPVIATGTIIVNFKNMVGDSALILNDAKSYVNQHNDTFTVNTFKYYISNVKLTRSDGFVFSETESYHLIDASHASLCMFAVSKVPFGTYTHISFMIGVDSIRNVSGAQAGALDPINDMFWSWNSGYIMAKLEGTSPQSTAGNHLLSYLIIGFGGQYNTVRTVSPSLNGNSINVSKEVVPQLDFKADVLEWFKTPTTISIAGISTSFISNDTAVLIANNYSDMITFQSIHQ